MPSKDMSSKLSNPTYGGKFRTMSDKFLPKKRWSGIKDFSLFEGLDLRILGLGVFMNHEANHQFWGGNIATLADPRSGSHHKDQPLNGKIGPLKIDRYSVLSLGDVGFLLFV